MKSLEKALRKIKSVFINQDADQITIQRIYLSEFFSADLLEISKTVGYPVLKPFVLEYFKDEGIETQFSVNEAQFTTLKDEQVKTLVNSLKLKEEVIQTLESSLNIKFRHSKL